MDGAWVVTWIPTEVWFAVPVPVTEAGENWHAASLGSWVHERTMVPLKPLETATVIEVLPDMPGAETDTCDPGAIEAENPAVITTLCDADGPLALKLTSPA